MNWHIHTGERSTIGVASAASIVVDRLEYLAEHGSRCNVQRLLDEAIQYARLLRGWVQEHQPPVTQRPFVDPMDYVGSRLGGKPGPMSDG